MNTSCSTEYWSRRPQVSVCMEGDNAILFDPDTGREKVINHTGLVLWNAMDGTTQNDDIAAMLARHYEVPLTDDIRSDADALAQELLRDGYADTAPSPRSEPLVPETYSRIEEAPRNVDLALTGKCNLACSYCFYADEMVGRQDLPVETWLTFFAELKGLAVRSLTLSGGEVFMRRNLWQLIDGVVDARMRYGILSNGTLITKKTIEEFSKGARRRRLDSIQVSIDGSCAAVHDASRGKGSFDKALRGLRLLKEAGFPVTVRVTVNRHNVVDLANTAKLLLDEIGLPSFSTNDAMAMGTGCVQKDSVVLAPEQRLTAMKTLVDLEKAYPGRVSASAGSLALWRMFREMEQAKDCGKACTSWKMGTLSSCGCMFSKLAVHHDGMIVPCNMLAAASLGSITDTPISDIWQNHPMLKEMKARRDIPMAKVVGCEGCEWIPFCNGGCPATVYTQTGDMNVANPDSCYRKFIQDTGVRMNGDNNCVVLVERPED